MLENCERLFCNGRVASREEEGMKRISEPGGEQGTPRDLGLTMRLPQGLRDVAGCIEFRLSVQGAFSSTPQEVMPSGTDLLHRVQSHD